MYIGCQFLCSNTSTNPCSTKLLLPHSCLIRSSTPSESAIPLNPSPQSLLLKTVPQLSSGFPDLTAVLEWMEIRACNKDSLILYSNSGLLVVSGGGAYDRGITESAQKRHVPLPTGSQVGRKETSKPFDIRHYFQSLDFVLLSFYPVLFQ